MFYPEESLKRGGRFYLCWVADAWPLRFAAITSKQLWSTDIRKLCEDLLEVVTNESGRPTNRFSLRLSSQLIRGLVRIYEKKAAVLLADLCMITAHVFNSTNKKYVSREQHERTPRALPRLQVAAVLAQQPEHEPRVEELLQNSGNAVINIQDITLKEATIPDFQLPPNDNFGEENPDQALQSLLGDRTVEAILVAGTSAGGAQHSALETSAVADKSNISQEKSRAAHDAAQMELGAEFDVTLFRKSTTADILPEFEKDVPEIPDIPALHLPSEPAPVVEMQVEEELQVPAPVEAAVPASVEAAPDTRAVDAELEELEEQPQVRKRRGKTRLIIDKKIKLGTEFLRARIDNPSVELRCESFTDAIIELRTPHDTLFRRPAAAGARIHTNMSAHLVRLFQRNLGFSHSHERLEAQEQETEQPRQRRTRSHLEQIAEVQEPQAETEQPLPPKPVEMVITGPADETNVIQDVNITDLNVTKDANAELDVTTRANAELDVTTRANAELDVTKNANMDIDVTKFVDIHVDATNDRFGILDVPNVDLQENVPMQVDIADLPTQKLETLSQARKRASEVESPPKRHRSGYMSFRESQQRNEPIVDIVIEEPDKENIAPNTQLAPQPRITRSVSTMLREAGLADELAGVLVDELAGLADKLAELPAPAQPSQPKMKEDSDSSETPLGSLDRTKVSLGDSVQTTDSQKFIRKQWGIEGTMKKVMAAIKSGRAVTVASLLAAGPAVRGARRLIAARCFSSLLKLKQHGFVRITKDPDTLEIIDITLGPQFDSL